MLNWSRALAALKMDIKVVSLSSNFSGHHQFFGIDFEYVKTKNPRFRATLRDLFNLQRAVIKQSKDFDVIHFVSNANSVSYVPCLFLLKVGGKKIVNSYNTASEISTKHLTDIFFDVFTVPSKRLFNSFNRLVQKKLKIIFPCVNTDLFRSQDKLKAREKLDIPLDVFVIFTVGHFKRGRRLLPFVHAVEQLAKKRKNIQLLIGWTGHGNEGDVQEAFATFKKKDFVKIIPPTDLINVYYNAIDVYVLTATFDHVIETPMSLIEALLSGVPVLSFDINAAPEIIETGVNGYLIEDNNFRDMTNTLEELFLDKSLLKKLATNAQSSLQHKFSYETVGCQLKNLYSELLEK